MHACCLVILAPVSGSCNFVSTDPRHITIEENMIKINLFIFLLSTNLTSLGMSREVNGREPQPASLVSIGIMSVNITLLIGNWYGNCE